MVGPKRSTLQAMLVNLENDEDMPALQSGSHSPPRSNNSNLAEVDDAGKTVTYNCSVDSGLSAQVSRRASFVIYNST